MEDEKFEACVGSLDFSDDFKRETQRRRERIEAFHRARIPDEIRIEIIKAGCLLVAHHKNPALPLAAAKVFEFFSQKDCGETGEPEAQARETLVG